jgi:hypothetical protein
VYFFKKALCFAINDLYLKYSSMA